MKKQILLTVATVTLAMTGCAQKKMNTTDNVGIVPVTNGVNLYENVDPMGQGMGQGSGTYGQANGLYGNENGMYGDAGVQNIYFDIDQYNITSQKLGQISHNANLLRNSGKIKIEGHCDASGSDEYNYALGLRRAKATKDALAANGISTNNITLVSMGESSPECATSSSADCYAKNRRVEFKVMQ
jgi:outer membrane protein OmpA-like peptidoglycan-associated protein